MRRPKHRRSFKIPRRLDRTAGILVILAAFQLCILTILTPVTVTTAPTAPTALTASTATKVLATEDYFMQNGGNVSISMLQRHQKTLWAAGVNARVPLKKYARIPIVTWTENAERIIFDRWHAVQFRPTCDRALFAHPYIYGVTSQLRDFMDLAIMSVLTFNRTIVSLEQFGTPLVKTWCEKRYWFDCYFQPLAGNQCNNVSKGNIKNLNGQYFRIGSERQFIRYRRHRIGGLQHQKHYPNNQDLFPTKLWDELVVANDVTYHDSATFSDVNYASKIKLEDPEMYHYLSLSALRSIIAKKILQPRPFIVERARALTRDIPPDEPVIAVHLRHTDKNSDNEVAAERDFKDHHVSEALALFSRQHSYFGIYRTILVLTDDPEAIGKLQVQLGPGYNVHGASDLKSLFKKSEDYEAYLVQGHDAIDSFYDHDPELAWKYNAAVVVDAVAAASRADYLVGVGASGVSQLIAQWMGAKRRVDGNALSLWEEDFL